MAIFFSRLVFCIVRFVGHLEKDDRYVVWPENCTFTGFGAIL